MKAFAPGARRRLGRRVGAPLRPGAGCATRGAVAAALAAFLLAAPGLAEPTPDPELPRLEAAVRSAPEDETARQALGDALFRSGRALDSMKVLNPGREPDASWAGELQKAAGVYAEGGWLGAARQALREAIELSPGDRSLYTDLARLGSEAAPVPAGSGAGDADSDAAAGAGAPALPHELGGWLAPERLRSATLPLALAALAGFGLLVAALRGMRGKGDLAVAIDYPPDRRGTFTVRLDRRRRRRSASAESAEADAARASTRYEHNMISRETQFRAIPARSYWVSLSGWLDHTEGDRRRSRVFEEKEVRVERRRAQRVEFDLRPRTCPVEIRIVHGGKPAPSARVALARDPTSLRFARDGIVKMGLGTGRYTLVVASEDRAAERPVAVEDLTPRTLVVDLADESGLVFRSCPQAVEPFLHGELSVAAQALERAGQHERAHLLRARFHRARGEHEKAAAQFEAAGRLLEAAEAASEAASFEHAATLFERAGDPARAAEMYQAAGDLLRAGRAHEEAGDLDAAAHCYREAKAIPKLIEVMEKLGDCYGAGQLALDRGDLSRALRNFQQVDARHERYAEVCRILAEKWSEQGKHELAVQKADEAITFSGSSEAGPDTFAWYGDLLERAGRTERALRTFEELQSRAPNHPGVAERVEELRRKVAGEQRARTARPADERYEVIRELGRGGMGVVYEVKDKRLGRNVALKRLPDNLKDHPRAVELFLREARSAAALNHPNIVTVHDVDQDDAGFFLTMELLEGQPLNEILKLKRRVAPRDTALLGIQVMAGLQYAHERHIIHRDIKTANLFFTRDRVAKIMDFGLAKMVAEVRRASTVIGGTPFYMSPEQSTGDAVDFRADLYSFGVTLFELLTGRVPFPDGDVTYRHRHEEPPDPRSLVAKIPEPFARLVLDLMRKDPTARPDSAATVATRLQQIHQGDPN